MEQLNDSSPQLRQWVAICLGRLWDQYEKARWTGVRDNAHEKLYILLHDPCPEVRAAAVYALGTFINSVAERSVTSTPAPTSFTFCFIFVDLNMQIQ